MPALYRSRRVRRNGCRYSLDDFVLVSVSLDTHSGDLGEIDIEQATSLRQGGQQVSAQTWISTSDDSHHREGVLVFPRRLEDGPVELLLKVGDGEVSLVWEGVPVT